MQGIRNHVRRAMMVAAGTVLVGMPAAAAMDRGDCERLFAAANVQRVVQFSIDRQGADFGDELHLGGAPLGKAVICWSIDGRIAVRGRLYAHDRDFAEASIRISFRRTNGQFTNPTTNSVLTQGGLFPANRIVERVSPVGRFNRVRLQLFTLQGEGSSAGPARSRQVANVNFNR